MSALAFEVCTVRDCGQMRRGAKMTCGRPGCGIVNTVTVNNFKTGSLDNDIEHRHIEAKFIRLGWKIGKTEKDNRCPGCFSAIKIAATRKRKEALMSSASKVVPMPPPVTVPPPKAVSQPPPSNGHPPPIAEHEPPRQMSRDERRIIFGKIDELYVGDKVGYADGWNDQRIATDLGVPRHWVVQLRDEYFGPERNEQVIEQARALLTELKAAAVDDAPLLRNMERLTQLRADLIGRADNLMKELARFT